MSQCPRHIEDAADELAILLDKDQHAKAHCPTVMTAAGPGTLGEGVRLALREFGAAGMPLLTILAKALPIVLADLAAGKSLSDIIKDVLAAFAAGTL